MKRKEEKDRRKRGEALGRETERKKRKEREGERTRTDEREERKDEEKERKKQRDRQEVKKHTYVWIVIVIYATAARRGVLVLDVGGGEGECWDLWVADTVIHRRGSCVLEGVETIFIY